MAPSRKSPSARSDSHYDIRAPRKAHQEDRRPPAYHGPHFEKGPVQEDIWNRRANGQTVTQQDVLGRAHSFEPPVRRHQYSDPYETRPMDFTPRMKDEYNHYSDLTKSKLHSTYRQAARNADAVRVGRNVPPTEEQCRAIEAGFAPASAARKLANSVVQARTGFDQKYPQAYQSIDAVESHRKEVANRRGSANDLRDLERRLADKLEKRARQMASGS
ncbi:uncharacterized protein N7459_007241 [Penicillium hispanicum]|uniref:uncharacterized protein n=1 Tax=Penicillium hispanicum TaxID=1080232 RepID=UPI0025405696|nr:uncharacterized protein N7459_007241 [Penicillium hispanicum]KAJ5578277.1 hypothetical protein N7459_007241 [Penicillium hispanicum]